MNKVFITGACGFIGSHLSEFLVKNNYEVTAFDRYNTSSDHGHLTNSKFKKNINFILGDIRDYDSVYKSMKGHDICLHLAALIGIPYSYESPLAYIRTNIEGTYNVLESVKNLNLDQAIITSTSETYGSLQFSPMNEKHPSVGQSPYSASKIAADNISISYHRSFNLPIKLIRPFNVYGPRQSLRAVIPTIISQLLSKNEIKLGNLNVKRDYTYVTDLCHGYEEILNNNIFYGQAINVGTNSNFSVEEIVKKIAFKLNKKNYKIIKEAKRFRPEKSEVDNLLCDNSFLINNSRWKQKVNFSDGLDKTIEWLKKYKGLNNTDNYYV